MRELLSQIITETAERDPRTVVLSGDHGYALFDRIRKQRPDQFINVGVIEQTMVGLAGGLAHTGLRPIVYGLSAFVPMRVLEQIKIDVCHPRLPVIFIGDGAGLVYSTLGVSHQCGEDLSCLLPLPHLRIYSPADREELGACFSEAWSSGEPAYVRIGKSDRGEIHAKGSVSSTGSSTGPLPVFRAPGARGLLIGTGTILGACLAIARELNLDCVSVPRLKPFPGKELMETLRNYSWVGVVEEHHRAGGLFSLLTQEWALNGGSTAALRWSSFTLEDHFTRTGGSYQHALSEHRLSDPLLRERVKTEMEASRESE